MMMPLLLGASTDEPSGGSFCNYNNWSLPTDWNTLSNTSSENSAASCSPSLPRFPALGRGRQTFLIRRICGNFRPGPIWQNHPPDQWLLECEQKVRLHVAVAVEHRPKYQHKRFIELGRQGMGKARRIPLSGAPTSVVPPPRFLCSRSRTSKHGTTMSDICCRITKTDGTTVTLWLPDKQVEAMADLGTPVGAALAEALGIVSIEIDRLEERPGANAK
jgi:hypothetical protein